MNAREASADLPPATFRELADFLRRTGSPLTISDAIARAVKLWIASVSTASSPVRGYQWKMLFLPDGSLVRMHYNDQYYLATVDGDSLVYRGQPVTPRQFTLAVAGEGRNAWRDLWIRMPGERDWTCAARRRRALEHQEKTIPQSPADIIGAAAKSMSDALQTALILVEHVSHQTTQKAERRLPRHRRSDDVLLDE